MGSNVRIRIGLTFRFQVVFDGVYRYSCFSEKKQRTISQSSGLKCDNTEKARSCGRTSIKSVSRDGKERETYRQRSDGSEEVARARIL